VARGSNYWRSEMPKPKPRPKFGEVMTQQEMAEAVGDQIRALSPEKRAALKKKFQEGHEIAMAKMRKDQENAKT
jgi:hypothetical protein